MDNFVFTSNADQAASTQTDKTRDHFFLISMCVITYIHSLRCDYVHPYRGLNLGLRSVLLGRVRRIVVVVIIYRIIKCKGGQWYVVEWSYCWYDWHHLSSDNLIEAHRQQGKYRLRTRACLNLNSLYEIDWLARLMQESDVDTQCSSPYMLFSSRRRRCRKLQR